MLNPEFADVLQEGQSKYSLVIAVAKRARIIAEDFPEQTKKPVTQALEEIREKKYKMVEPK